MPPPTPSDPKLYAKVKKQADSKFLAPTSAYKSAWIVREYKKNGGTYEADKGSSKDSNGLARWFKEKWVDLNRPGEVCGRPRATTANIYPLCRPSIRVTKDTPKTVHELTANEVAAAKKEKQRVKQTGRVKFSKTL